MGPYCCPAIILHCSNSFTLLFLDDYFTLSLQFSNLHSLPPHHSYLDNFAFCFTDKIEVVRAFPQVPTHAFINTVLFLFLIQLNCPGSQLRPILSCPLDTFPSCLLENNVPEILLPFPYNIKILLSTGSFPLVYKHAIVSPILKNKLPTLPLHLLPHVLAPLYDKTS